MHPTHLKQPIINQPILIVRFIEILLLRIFVMENNEMLAFMTNKTRLKIV